jgi:hypothetical protein
MAGRKGSTLLAATMAILIIPFSQDPLAQDQTHQRVQDSGPGSAASNRRDARGITVGIPRAFDNRTLTLMLEGLSSSLAGLKFVDQKSIAQALGTLQGSQVHEVARELTLQGLPTPQAQTSASQTAGQTTQTGGANPASTTTASQTSSASSTTPSTTPTIPWNPDLATAPPSAQTPSYSIGASDLLTEQVDLTYQIFNIRMLLDRALGDRLLWDHSGVSKPRLQTVIGTNVWLDPPRDAENSAAVVEITIEQATPTPLEGERPSLVAMMPQEHTYNASSLSLNSNAFGGSAVASVVQVGYSQRDRAQTYYLYRDNDTVAYEQQADPNKGSTTFGWVFRPVLGRKSVSPGPRQMFAVLSLPVDDSQGTIPRVAVLVAHVRAYWKKYDPGTLTTANSGEIRPWSKVAHVFSLATSLTYPPPGETDVTGYKISVPTSRSLGDDLAPRINHIMWRPVGASRAEISVKGENLYQDTRVAIGDRTLSGPADGLRLVSDQGFDVLTDLAALSADAVVLGRYAPATPLEQTVADKTGPLMIGTADWHEPLGGFIELTIEPRFGPKEHWAAPDACLHQVDLRDDVLGQPIVFINGAPIPGPYTFLGNDCVSIAARVSQTITKDLGGIVMLKFPFRGRAFEATYRSYDPTANYTMRVLTASREFLLQKADGPFVPSGQTDITAANWQAIVNSRTIPLKGACSDGPASQLDLCLPTPHDNLARLSFPPPPAVSMATRNADPQSKGDSMPKAILLQYAAPDGKKQLAWSSTYVVGMPASEADPVKPVLDKDQKTLEVTTHAAVWRTVTGSGLAGVGSVLVGSIPLKFAAAKDGNSIAILLDEPVTRVVREGDITFYDKQAQQIGIAHLSVK